MHSQRHKKKNAQFKRKRHEAKERSEARSKQNECLAPEGRNNGEDDHKLATLQPTVESDKESRESLVTIAPVSGERSRYKKRVVESNWDKYDLPSQGGYMPEISVHYYSKNNHVYLL